MLVIVLSLVIFVGALVVSIIIQSKNQKIDDLRNNVDYLETNTSKMFETATGGKITNPETPFDDVIKEIKK